MRAHWHIRRFTREDSNEAIRLLDELLRRQPDNALALADLAFSLHFAALFGWTYSPDEAKARLDHLNAHGPSDVAFGWADLPSAKLFLEKKCA